MGGLLEIPKENLSMITLLAHQISANYYIKGKQRVSGQEVQTKE